MSLQEARKAFIEENIQKLIKALTGFSEEDENFRLCLNFAHSITKYHRNLSVDSHDIRRRVNGIVEKFTLDNRPDIAERFNKLCQNLINHPLCKDHYATDIQWAILDLLLGLSYNPLGALERGEINLESMKAELDSSIREENDVDIMVGLLKEDNFVESKHYSSSELSDWSDDESNEGVLATPIKSDTSADIEVKGELAIISAPSVFPTIRPPVKPSHYVSFDSTDSHKWLMENIQPDWWNKKESVSDVNSPFFAANFCEIWHSELIKEGSVVPSRVSTISEYCLLREIIWMFFQPTNCKFFLLTNDTIDVHDGVSISSVTEKGMKQFLLHSFAKYMTIVYRLKKFCKVIVDGRYSHTLEAYAVAIEDLLDPFFKTLIVEEEEIRAQKDHVIYTVMTLYHKLLPYFDIITVIWEHIHQKVVLDMEKYPAHIVANYLLVTLLNIACEGSNFVTTNIAFSIFMVCIRLYLNILDDWTTDGILLDNAEEFVIERDLSEESSYQLRPISEDVVPLDVIEDLSSSNFIDILMNMCLDYGYSLGLLQSVNKLNELRMNKKMKTNLYQKFCESVIMNLKKFTANKPVKCLLSNNLEIGDAGSHSVHMFNNQELEGNDFVDIFSTTEIKSPLTDIKKKHANSLQQFKRDLKAFGDDMLFMLFMQGLPETEGEQKKTVDGNIDYSNMKCTDFICILNNITHLILPFEAVAVKQLDLLLSDRISLADKFLMDLYLNEFMVLKHLKNLRMVYLLEASDTMHQFYSKLFNDMKNSINWSNSYMLSIQLDEMLTARYPDMISLFRVEVQKTTTVSLFNVLQSIDSLSIYYSIDDALKPIVTDEHLQSYNTVFKFFLKIKYGLTTLENLRFPLYCKQKKPYSEVTLSESTFKRLAMLRMWLIYTLQCLNNHLVTFVIQTLNAQFERKLEKARNVNDIIKLHNSFVKALSDQCFQYYDKDIHMGIMQLLSLVDILRMDWELILGLFEHHDEADYSLNGDSTMDSTSYSHLQNDKIDDLEGTYTNVHSFIERKLNEAVFARNRTHLSALHAAFHYSKPY